MKELNLTSLRVQIGNVVRRARQSRHWSQAELAGKLDLSQARLSVIERGEGSFSAEQLVLLLGIFNLTIEDIVPSSKEDALQNALARLGALHLRAYEGVPISQKYQDIKSITLEVLLNPTSNRLICALAPALIWNGEFLEIDGVYRELIHLGRAARWGWLLENLVQATTRLSSPSPKEWSFRIRKTTSLIKEFLQRIPELSAESASWDVFDPDLLSSESIRVAKNHASPVSLKWHVLSELQPETFAEAIENAYTSH